MIFSFNVYVKLEEGFSKGYVRNKLKGFCITICQLLQMHQACKLCCLVVVVPTLYFPFFVSSRSVRPMQGFMSLSVSYFVNTSRKN